MGKSFANYSIVIRSRRSEVDPVFRNQSFRLLLVTPPYTPFWYKVNKQIIVTKGVELQAAFLLRISLTSPFFVWLINAGFQVPPCSTWEAKGGTASVIPHLR